MIKVSTLFVEYNGDVDPTINPYRIVVDKCIDLGIYKSKERALEVLDEIQKIIGWIQNDMKDVTIEDYKKLIGSFNDYVYEMPKE